MSDATAIEFDSARIIEYMFSDEKLGVPVNAILKEMSSISNPGKGKGCLRKKLYTYPDQFSESNPAGWKNVPDLSNTSSKQGKWEKELGDFLFKIAEVAWLGFEKVLTIGQKWTSYFSKYPLVADSSIQCMPDLIDAKSQHIHGHSLKAKRWHTRLRWEFVDILAELKCRRNEFNDLFKDLSNKAFAIFQSQINHCFVTSLAFWKHNLSFIVFD